MLARRSELRSSRRADAAHASGGAGHPGIALMVLKPTGRQVDRQVDRQVEGELELDRNPAHDNSAWLNAEHSEKVSELVARRILRDIVERNLGAGEMLPPEAAMTAQYGVARASLREALRILETHGLVRIKAGSRGGPVVTHADSTDYGRVSSFFLFRAGATYLELLHARLFLEPRMARLAAELLTETSAERLRNVLEEGRATSDAPPSAWSAATERFHSVIAGMTGNHVLDLFAGALVVIERRHIGPMFSAGADREATLHIHERIAQAILMRDGDKAERLARLHIEELISLMETRHRSRLEDRIEWSST